MRNNGGPVPRAGGSPDEREEYLDQLDAAREREAEEIAAGILDGRDRDALVDMLGDKMNARLARNIWLAALGFANHELREVLETAAREYAWECVYPPAPARRAG